MIGSILFRLFFKFFINTLSLISLPILSVSLLHTALTSRLSYLGGKGAEHRIEKTQTYTTQTHLNTRLVWYSDGYCIRMFIVKAK